MHKEQVRDTCIRRTSIAESRPHGFFAYHSLRASAAKINLQNGNVFHIFIIAAPCSQADTLKPRATHRQAALPVGTTAHGARSAAERTARSIPSPSTVPAVCTQADGLPLPAVKSLRMLHNAISIRLSCSRGQAATHCRTSSLSTRAAAPSVFTCNPPVLSAIRSSHSLVARH